MLITRIPRISAAMPCPDGSFVIFVIVISSRVTKAVPRIAVGVGIVIA
jgi:hypothetical protein